MAIYTLTDSTLTPFAKTYYQYIEKAINVVTSVTTTQAASATPTYSPATVQSTSVGLTISVQFTASFTSADYYVIKTPAMGSSATLSSTSVTFGGALGSCNVLVLPKNRFIIISGVSSTVTGGTYSGTIPGLINPYQGQGTAAMAFYGFVTHFSTMTAEKTSYTAASDFTALTSFSTTPTVTISNTDTKQNAYITITINAIFSTVRSVIIVLPTQLAIKEDCYETPSSAIPVLQCLTDQTANNKIYISLEARTYLTTPVNLQIRALVLNGGTAGTAGTVSPFDYYLYSIVQTDNTQTQNLVYSVTGVSPSITLVATTAPAPTLIEANYVPYKEYFDSQASGTYGEIVFQHTLTQTLNNNNQIVISLTNSFLTFGTNIETVTGDFTPQPAIIIREPTDLASYNGQILILATYTAPSLSFNLPIGITLSSGKSPIFKITKVAQTKSDAYVGPSISVASPYAYVSDVIMQIYSSNSVMSSLYLTGQVGTLFPQSSNLIAITSTPILSKYLTAAAGATNVLRFSFTTASSIDNFFIDFPSVDDFGNAVWDTNLGTYTDKTRVPCVFVAAIECIFFQGSGTQAQPSRIQVRGYGNNLPNGDLYIVGMTNPTTTDTYLFNNIRFYSGTTYKQITRIVGFKTVTSALTFPTADDTTYYVSTNRLYGSRTHTFYTAVAIPTDSILLLKLDPSCTATISSPFLFATGAIGTYVLRFITTAIAAGGSYTFNNAICPTTIGIAFTEYHMTSPSGGTGEVRPANLVMPPLARQTAAAVSISSFASMYSGVPQGTSGLSYKLSFSLTSFSSVPVTTGYVMTIDFDNLYFDTFSGCQYISGMTTIPGQSVSCTTTSTTLVITNFKALDSSTNFIVMMTYKSLSSSYASGTPLAKVKFFVSSTLQGAGDYTTYSSFSVSPIYIAPVGLISMTTMPFTAVPGPGITSTITLSIPDSTYAVASTTVSSGTTFNIYFDATEAIFVALSTTCTVTSGTSYVTPTCTIDATKQVLTATFNAAATITYIPAIDIIISHAHMPLRAAAYIYRIEIGPQTAPLLSTSTIVDNLIVTTLTMSATALHQTQGATYNEYKFSVTTPVALSANKGLSFTYTGLSLKQLVNNQIDCLCVISSALTTATCYNYGGTAIDIFITASVNSAIDCYVPDISQSTSAVTLVGNIMDLYSRAVYYQTTIPSITLAASTATTHTLSVGYPTTTLTAAGSGTVTATIGSATSYAANSVAYVDFGSGLIPPACTAALSLCRVYSTIRNILVMTFTTAQSGTSTLFSSSVTYPSTVSENTGPGGNYTFYSFVASSGAIIDTGSFTPSTITNYYPRSTTLTATLLGSSVKGLPNLIKLTTSAFAAGIPYTVSGVGGFIQIVVTNPSNFGSSCYASTTIGGAATARLALPCTVSSSSSSATFTITNPSAAITSGDKIELSFSANNPTSCKLSLFSLFLPFY